MRFWSPKNINLKKHMPSLYSALTFIAHLQKVFELLVSRANHQIRSSWATLCNPMWANSSLCGLCRRSWTRVCSCPCICTQIAQISCSGWIWSRLILTNPCSVNAVLLLFQIPLSNWLLLNCTHLCRLRLLFRIYLFSPLPKNNLLFTKDCIYFDTVYFGFSFFFFLFK